MGTRTMAVAWSLLAALAPGVATAGVTVQFVAPERYTDAGDGYRDSQYTLKTLAAYLQAQGTRCLRPGETLALSVYDVDLAGRMEWWRRGGSDVRVLREISWPRMEVGYVLRDGSGTALREARERVADMNYLLHSIRAGTDSLPYEKAMLRGWMERRFCER